MTILNQTQPFNPQTKPIIWLHFFLYTKHNVNWIKSQFYLITLLQNISKNDTNWKKKKSHQNFHVTLTAVDVWEDNFALLWGSPIVCSTQQAFGFFSFSYYFFMKTIFREGRGWKTEWFIDGFEPHRVPDWSCICNLDSNKYKIRNHRDIECLLVFIFYFFNHTLWIWNT